MRIADSMRYRTMTSDLAKINQENFNLLQQSSTGRLLNRPSDNPADSIRQLRIRRDISTQQDLMARIKTATEEVARSELALDDALSLFSRAKELALDGATGARTDLDFDALATEADQLLHDLVAIANRQVGERYIFSGTATTTKPFSTDGPPITTITYVGNDASRTVTPSPGLEININVPGDQIFQGAADTFQALINLRTAAQNRDVDAMAGSVGQGLDQAFDALVNLRTRVGAITGSLQRATENLDLVVVEQEAQLSSLEDVDLVDVLIRLQTNQTRRQATLQVIGMTHQVSLLDFLV